MDKNKAIQNAQKFLQRGQIDKAIREYRKVVEADPQDVRTRMKVGDLLAKKGATGEACETYLGVAETYGQQGFLLKAVAVYKQVLKIDPNLVDVNLKLAELYHQLGLVSDAMTQYQSVANFFEQRGDTRRSLETLQRVLDLDPDNATSRIKLAEMFVKEGLTEDALAQLRQAASLLKEQSRTEDWIRVMERLVYLSPDEVQPSRELAETYLARGEAKRALAKLQICFRTDPRDVGVLKLLARAFGDLGQPSKAASVHRELGRLLGSSGDEAGRRAAWQNVLALAPGDPEALAALGQGRAQEAAPKPTPSQAATPRPAAPAARPMRAPEPRAAAPVAAAEPLDPDAVRKVLTETDVYIKYGLKDKALQHLDRVLAAVPDDLEALRRLRTLHQEAGDAEAEADAIARMVAVAARQGSPEAGRLLEALRALVPDHPDLQRLTSTVDGMASEGDDIVVLEEDFPEVEEVDGADEVEVLEEDDDEAILLMEDDAGDSLELRTGDEDASSQAGRHGDADLLVLADDGEDDEVLLLGDDEPSGEADEVVLLDGETDDEVVFLDGDPDDDEVVLLDGDPDDDEVVFLDGDPDDDEVVLLDGDAGAGEAVLLDEGSDDEAVLLDGDPADDEVVLLDGDADADEAVLLDGDADDDEVMLLDGSPDHALLGGDATGDRDADLLTADGEGGAVDRDPVVPTEADPGAGAEVSQDDLDMARFFVQQGLEDEARETLEALRRVAPGHPEVLRLLAELDGGPDEEEFDAPKAVGGEDGDDDEIGFDDFDLAGELEQELASLETEEESFAKPLADFQISADDVFSEFKKGVARAVSEGDADTHYDLGIAYREMGLVRDAIGEFELAASSASKRVEARTLVGICHRELGETDRAVAALEGLLDGGDLPPETRKAILFELADTHAQIDARAEAIRHFRAVQAIDPGFRQVAERLAALGDDGAPLAAEERPSHSGSPRRGDKVGYL